jgi:uncharacterized membrane protein
MVVLKLFWKKWNLKPLGLTEWLCLSAAFSVLLLIARVLITGEATYLFLPWNLFLAFIPLYITNRMQKHIRLLENKWLFFVLLSTWLLFIPNSFYIITDLFHLTHIDSAPKWFDLLLIFSFAWNGLLLGILSVRKMELFASLQFGKPASHLFVFVVMWLSAFGIYIGRFLRFNSWDVLTNPFSLMTETGAMILHPLEHGFAWGMTICYAAFMSLVYFTVGKIRG